jgi:hypothetical protein
MKRFLMLAAVLAMTAGVADAKSCKDSTTHKFIKCPAAVASSAPAMSSMASSSKKPPHCVKGKVCGDSCIAKTDVCHK